MRYYPAFLDINGKKCVIAGGGQVAGRKAVSLLKAGAKVTIISPELSGKLSQLKEKGLVAHLRREFRKGDLKRLSPFLAYAATDCQTVNEAVSREASMLGIPVNIVDQPALSSFIVPSVVARGPLQIAISTSGASPAMAKSIRLEIEKLYGKEFGAYLRKRAKARAAAVKNNRDGLAAADRRRLFKKAGAGDIIEAIRRGKTVPD